MREATDLRFHLRSPVEAHPRLFRGKLPGSSYVPRGWFDLLDRLCADIEDRLTEEGCALFEVRDIKQKFGALVVDYGFVSDVGQGNAVAPDLEHRQVAVARVEADRACLRDLVDAACSASEAACERCGKPAELRELRSRMATLCEFHYRGAHANFGHPRAASFTSLLDPDQASLLREAKQSPADVYVELPAKIWRELESNAWMNKRTEAADMVDEEDAARLAGISCARLHSFVNRKPPRAIAIEHPRLGTRYPRWQFEPQVWPVVQRLAVALNANAGAMLVWMATPLGSLDGRTPRSALEQGVRGERVLDAAGAEWL